MLWSYFDVRDAYACMIGFRMLGFIYLVVGLAPFCFMDLYDMCFAVDDAMIVCLDVYWCVCEL